MKVLIIDKIHKDLISLLKSKGFSVDYQPEIEVDKFLSIVKNYDILILRSKFKIDKKIIDIADNLKVIGRAGAGLENIDIEYCNKKSIKVVNSPEGNRDAVAEHALGMLLMLFNKINIADKQIREGKWDRETNWGEELTGKTIGIIGYGNMGSTFASRLSSFDVNILVYDKYKTNFSNTYIKEVQLDEIFKKADIVSFHVPLNEETKYYFNDNFISKMAKNFYLINTSRGAVVNTDDLVKNIKTEKIKGACLDVLEYEKFNFENAFLEKNNNNLNYLINSNKVVLTPHVAGWTNQSYRKISVILGEKIIKLLS